MYPDSGGGRDRDSPYMSGHLPPISQKYRVASSTRADMEHATDPHNIETGNDYPTSSRLTHPSKVVPTTSTEFSSGPMSKHDLSEVQTHHDVKKSSSRNVRACSPDVSKFNQDTQHPIESGGGAHDKLPPTRGDRNNEKNSDNVSQWKKLHRIVEQMDDEPCCIILFKWLLIIVGLGMLIAVIEIMGEVMYAWFSGDLEKNLHAIKKDLKEASMLNPTESSINKQINETMQSEATTGILKSDG